MTLMKLQTKKFQNSKPLSTLTQFQVNQFATKQFNNTQQSFVSLLYKEEVANLKKMLTSCEFEDLTFLQKLLDGQETQDQPEFELQKEFKSYLTQNNLSTIIRVIDSGDKISYLKNWKNQDPCHKSEDLRWKIMKSSLHHYMLFPNEYFQRFYLKKNENTQKKEEVKGGKQSQIARNMLRKLRMQNRNRFKKLTNQPSQIMPMQNDDLLKTTIQIE